MTVLVHPPAEVQWRRLEFFVHDLELHVHAPIPDNFVLKPAIVQLPAQNTKWMTQNG